MSMLQAKKTPSMIVLEKLFSDIQEGRNVNRNLDEVAKVMTRMYSNVDCTQVLISERKYDTKFYGMMLFPSEVEMKRLKSLIFKQGKPSGLYIKSYVIEIDWRLLYDKDINATPQEMVAILFHELGHLVLTDRPFQELKKYTTSTIVAQGINGALLSSIVMSGNPISSIIVPLLIVNIMSNLSKRHISNLSEKDADSYAILVGYGEDLANIVGKFLQVSKNEFINYKFKDYDEDNKVITDWSIDNILHFEKRADSIVELTGYQIEKTSSSYLTMFLKDKHRKLNQSLSKFKLASLRQSAQNKFDSGISMALSEGIFFNKNYTVIRKKELSEFEIMMQDISTVDDKLYLLELIAATRDKVSSAMKFIEKNGEGSTSILYRNLPNLDTLKLIDKDLEDLQRKLVKMKYDEAPNTKLIYVAYPKGFEG